MSKEKDVVLTTRKSKKKLLITLGCIVLVLAIAATVVFQCFIPYRGEMYEDFNEVYAYFNEKSHTSACYDMSKYDKKLNKVEEEYFELDAQVATVLKKATPLPKTFDGVIEKGNKILVDFFANVYGVSVEAELKDLRVTYAKLPNDIGGVYYTLAENITDGKVVTLADIYVNDVDPTNEESWGAFEETDFYGTYFHEAIHYLGSYGQAQKSTDWCELIEGITEALTIKALAFGGYDDENTSYYICNTNLAQQLLVVDKEIVVRLINGVEYMTVKDLEEYFDSKSFAGMGSSLEKAVALTSANPGMKKYQRMAQHFMGEYIKYYNPTQEQMNEIATYFIAPVSAFAD